MDRRYRPFDTKPLQNKNSILKW